MITSSIANGLAMGCSAAETAKIMKEVGFGGVDLGICFSYEKKVDRDQWVEDVLQEAQVVKAAGLEISQCHLPYYPGHIDNPGNGDYQDFEDLILPDYVRALMICKQIGCHLAVMHPYFTLSSIQGSIEGNVKMLTKLMPLMEEYDVSIALENIYASRNGQYLKTAVSEPKYILEIIERMNTTLVGACIDTGHANIFEINIVEMAKMYGKHLIALHANGNAGKDEHVIPLSMSGWCENMDFVEFSKTLKDIGYQGNYNLELNSNSFLPSSCVKPFYAYAAAVGGYLDELRR